MNETGGKLLEALESERKRIAGELHDDIGQRLSLLVMELETVTTLLPDSLADARTRTEKLRQQVVEILDSVHALSHRLYSSRLRHLGLAVAAKALCKEFEKQHKISMAFEAGDIPESLGNHISLTIFRILQESLHNVSKHSKATKVSVRLSASSRHIELVVQDNGLGFNVKQAQDSEGFGLASMRERIELVKGTLSIASGPHSGTEIRACAPLITSTLHRVKSAGV